VREDATGKSFTIRFTPGQRLPEHRNSERIAIIVVNGSGVLTVEGEAPRPVRAGDVIQLDPRVGHAVGAPEEALELRVVLRPPCCGSC